MHEKIISVALGKVPADVAIKNGNLVNVFTGEIYGADVAIFGNRIAAVGDVEHCIGDRTTIIDANGKYLVPGLIDGHVHMESSMMDPLNFAKALLPLGTTSIVTDLHEIGTVMGLNGIREMLNICWETPLKFFLVVPSHVPFLKGLETTGAEIGLDEINEALKWKEAVGLSEVLVPPVISQNDSLLRSIERTIALGKTVEGHAAGFSGKELQAHVASGVESDHEATTAGDALERARLGIGLMIREGSVSKDLSACIKVLTEFRINAQNCMLATDDIHPIDLVKYGHMDYKVRRAIEEGVDPVIAVQMATLNPARHFRIDRDVGGIAPGKIADILIVENLRKFKVERVIANGKIVAQHGKFTLNVGIKNYENFKNTVRLRGEIKPEDLKINSNDGEPRVDVRTIVVKDDTLLKDEKIVTLDVEDGSILPDTSGDILEVAVVERHKGTGNIGKAFISGFGLRDGAIASSVAHDNHNIIVVGTNLEDMADAVNKLAKAGGGLVAIEDGKCLGLIELPICGLLSTLDVSEMRRELEVLHEAVRNLGCGLKSPFMTLSFVTCAIPRLCISDKGLIDPVRFELVDLIIKK